MKKTKRSTAGRLGTRKIETPELQYLASRVFGAFSRYMGCCEVNRRTLEFRYCVPCPDFICCISYRSNQLFTVRYLNNDGSFEPVREPSRNLLESDVMQILEQEEAFLRGELT